MRNIIIIFLLLINNIPFSYGQEQVLKYPKIGDTLPDHTFNDLVNFAKKKISINDFRGQWLLLDVWSRGCTGCIASFPKMDKLSKQFKGKINFIMVGEHMGRRRFGNFTDEQLTKDLFTLQSKKHSLTFANAFDSTFHAKFDCSTPTIFIVNPQGVIVQKTRAIDSVRLEQVFRGEKVQLQYANAIHEDAAYAKYNLSVPLLTTGGVTQGGFSDTTFIYRSLFSRWKVGMPVFMETGFVDVLFREGIKGDTFELKENVHGRAEALGFDLIEMLWIAYEGGISNIFPRQHIGKSNLHKLRPIVVLELKDSALFAARNMATGENTYCYSLTIPDRGACLVSKLKYMKDDLHRTFGFTSGIESRAVPALKSVVINRRKLEQLRSEGKKEFSTDKQLDYGVVTRIYKNWSLFELGNALSSSLKLGGIPATQIVSPIPFFDETGVDFNISITIKADFEDLESVGKALRKHGLDLIRTTKSLPCIVVKDANPMINSN